MTSIIGLASGIGGGDDRSKHGPLKIQEKCILTSPWIEMIREPDEVKDKCTSIGEVNTILAQKAKEVIERGDTLLSVGGDHSCGIGTWSGISQALHEKEEELGLIWVDAHLDMHTLETSETGNIHGMPVAALLGHGDKRLTEVLSKRAKIRPENMFFVGIRSFESPELDLAKCLGIRVYFIDEVFEKGIATVLNEIVEHFQTKKIPYGISLDVDVFDPSEIPATGTPEQNGMPTNDFVDWYKTLIYPPIAFEFVEYNPSVDPDEKSLPAIQKILSQVLAKWHSLPDAACSFPKAEELSEKDALSTKP